MNPECQSCRNSYPGADDALRCRVSSNGMKCSPEAADGCKRYEYEPGTDAEEITITLCSGCVGRGD